MKEIVNFVDVESCKFNIEGVRMKECIKKTCVNGKQVKVEKIDECSFEFGGNYANKIFTSRSAGNALYCAMKSGNVELSSNDFGNVSKAASFLRSRGFDFKIGC